MVLVSRHPPFFHKADDPRRQCGAYQLRAVLHAFGAEAPVHKLYSSPLASRLDLSLPWLMPRVLTRHGIASELRYWGVGSFVSNLAGAIEADRPTLFIINSIRGRGSWHWISAWGHDPETSEFICYDSQAPTTFGTERGNTRYHTDQLTTALPWWGTYALTIHGA